MADDVLSDPTLIELPSAVAAAAARCRWLRREMGLGLEEAAGRLGMAVDALREAERGYDGAGRPLAVERLSAIALCWRVYAIRKPEDVR